MERGFSLLNDTEMLVFPWTCLVHCYRSLVALRIHSIMHDLSDMETGQGPWKEVQVELN